MDTTVILTPTEAEQFIRFQKHHALFVIMEEAGAFDIGYGKVILNVAGGVVQNIVKEEIMWKR